MTGFLIEPAARPCYQHLVRLSPLGWASSLLVLGACPGGGPSGGGKCFVDQECISGEVCARDELCWPEGEVRFVKTTWTVRGQTASAANCTTFPDLHIRFDGGSVPDDLGFAPVPCETGMFVVDKLPRAFTTVELRADRRGAPTTFATIDAAGMAVFDLRF